MLFSWPKIVIFFSNSDLNFLYVLFSSFQQK